MTNVCDGVVDIGCLIYMQNISHKLYGLLPPKLKAKYNLRNNTKVFRISRFYTKHFQKTCNPAMWNS